MLKVLNQQNILLDERKALKRWTSKSEAKFYRDIKKASENKYKNTTHILEENHIKWFNSLESLFENYEDNDFKSVVIQRAKLIKENKKVHTVQEILFQEAEKIRFDGNQKEATVESAYRRVLNSKECNNELKLEAIYKLANYKTNL